MLCGAKIKISPRIADHKDIKSFFLFFFFSENEGFNNFPGIEHTQIHSSLPNIDDSFFPF